MDVPTESAFETAERHVREGEKHIAKQKALIEHLERDGHENLLPAARELLAVLEQSLTAHREHAASERRVAHQSGWQVRAGYGLHFLAFSLVHAFYKTLVMVDAEG